jgi:hypothetical protein
MYQMYTGRSSIFLDLACDVSVKFPYSSVFSRSVALKYTNPNGSEVIASGVYPFEDRIKLLHRINDVDHQQRKIFVFGQWLPYKDYQKKQSHLGYLLCITLPDYSEISFPEHGPFIETVKFK